jgi:hypothetical protein
VIVPFPFGSASNKPSSEDTNNFENSNTTTNNIYAKWAKHPAIIKLSRVVDLEKNCGYVTMINIRGATSTCGAKKTPIRSGVDLKTEAIPSKLEEVAEELVKEDGSNDDSISEEDYHLVVHSSPEQPKNGFKDDNCAKLYQEELDNEFKNLSLHPETNTASIEPHGFDPRQQKLESLRLDLKLTGDSVASTSLRTNKDKGQIDRNSNERHCFDDWTILDCYFGIPLFDAGVNQVTCERMQKNELWEPQR